MLKGLLACAARALTPAIGGERGGGLDLPVPVPGQVHDQDELLRPRELMLHNWRLTDDALEGHLFGLFPSQGQDGLIGGQRVSIARTDLDSAVVGRCGDNLVLQDDSTIFLGDPAPDQDPNVKACMLDELEEVRPQKGWYVTSWTVGTSTVPGRLVGCTDKVYSNSSSVTKNFYYPEQYRGLATARIGLTQTPGGCQTLNLSGRSEAPALPAPGREGGAA
jgi:hypothetical protein